MKHLISLIFILTISFSFAQKKKWLDSEFEPTKKKYARFYLDEKQEGDITTKNIYSLSDNKYNHYTYQYGILNGSYALYYYDGSVREEGFYKHGVKNGVVTKYSPNGNIYEQTNYVDGKSSGLYTRNYYNRNQIYDSSYYETDKLNGVSYTFDKEDGTINVKEYYVNDKRNGASIGYYNDGLIKDSCYYLDGKIKDTLYLFHRNGLVEGKRFYKSGKLEGLKITFWDNEVKRDSTLYVNGEKQGVSKFWNKEGQLTSVTNYVDGKKQGVCYSYWSNGFVKRKQLYTSNKLQYDSCFSSAGTDTTFYEIEKMPSFPGGEGKLYEYLGKNIKYPAGAKYFNTQGKVYVQFVVKKTGEIKDVEVVRGIGDGCDKEAVRVVEKMPKWSPGEQRGKKVNVKHTLPVVYKLR